MERIHRRTSPIRSALLLAAGWLAIGLVSTLAQVGMRPATNELRADGVLEHWLVLGPFPNEKTDAPMPPEDVTRQGFQTDYLQPLGGEAATDVRPDTTVILSTADGSMVRAIGVSPNKDGVIDFLQLYPDKPESVAYAFCQISSATAQPLHLLVGHDDCAKIWLNGKLLHRVWRENGHGMVKRAYQITGQLEPGLNRLLVKVENWGYAWNLHLEAFDAATAKPILDDIEQTRAAQQALSALQDCRVRPDRRGGYFTQPGTFPEIVWDNPEAVRRVLGDVPLTVQWHNSRLEPVGRPTSPGRYLAAITGATADGRQIRRMLTVYCRDPQWMPWYETNKVYLTYPNRSGFNRQAFEANREQVAPMLGRFLMDQMFENEAGASLAAYWQELQPDKPLQPYETPDVIQNDLQVALKRKLLGVDYPSIAAPQIRTQPARVLHPGSASDAGVPPDASDRLREVCEAWAEQSGEPFNILIARHGVIVLHDAFGDCTVDQKHSVASITKAVAGLMFARFVDQQLIDVDHPVGKYLPDFPVTGPKAVTMRQLFTHTTGLDGHGRWGGLGNAWLDNVVTLSLDQLPVGEVHLYNGMGYDLAGKVMEIVAGHGIQRVIQEQFWLPLGIEGSSLTDLGFSAMLNAEDIAKMGQLLLNQGSYGDREFFTPETYAKLLPVDLSGFYPKVAQEWGIGLTYRRTERMPGNPDSGYLLSKNIIGHGSATSCLFLVDLEHDLVIAQSRRTAGEGYDTHFRRLLETLEQIMAESPTTEAAPLG